MFEQRLCFDLFEHEGFRADTFFRRLDCLKKVCWSYCYHCTSVRRVKIYLKYTQITVEFITVPSAGVNFKTSFLDVDIEATYLPLYRSGVTDINCTELCKL